MEQLQEIITLLHIVREAHAQGNLSHIVAAAQARLKVINEDMAPKADEPEAHVEEPTEEEPAEEE